MYVYVNASRTHSLFHSFIHSFIHALLCHYNDSQNRQLGSLAGRQTDKQTGRQTNIIEKVITTKCGGRRTQLRLTSEYLWELSHIHMYTYTHVHVSTYIYMIMHIYIHIDTCLFIISLKGHQLGGTHQCNNKNNHHNNNWHTIWQLATKMTIITITMTLSGDLEQSVHRPQCNCTLLHSSFTRILEWLECMCVCVWVCVRVFRMNICHHRHSAQCP